MTRRLGRAAKIVNLLLDVCRIRLFAPRDERSGKTKRAVFATFAELGGVYVKFLQALAVDSRFVGEWAGPRELAVFENAGYSELDIQHLVQARLPSAQRAAFRHISVRPFAAGSFGQVYRAELADGSPVVIKALKPDLLADLRIDLKLIGMCVAAVSLSLRGQMVDVRSAYRQFATATRAEVDYENEVISALWFEKYYEHDDKIVVPHTYRELSCKEFITQDYVGGVSLAGLLDAGGDARQTVAQQLSSSLDLQLWHLGSSLIHASLHAPFMLGDPNPGNVKLLPDNKIGLIDFGNTAPTPVDKLGYLDLLKQYHALFDGTFCPGAFAIAALRFFDKKLAESIELIDGVAGGIVNTISAHTTDVFYNNRGEQLAQDRHIITIFRTAINQHNVLGLQLDNQSLPVLRSARMFLETVRRLSPDNEAFIVKQALEAEIAYARSHGLRFAPAADDTPLPFDRAIETVVDWALDIAVRNPLLYYHIKNTVKEKSYA